jgi:phosphocarrier protein
MAGTFAAEITVSRAGLEINGKSIMGVLMLAAACDSTIVIEAVGTDEDVALAALGKLVEDGFGELDGD